MDNLLVSNNLKDKILWYVKAHSHSSIGGLGLISTFLKFSGSESISVAVDECIKIFQDLSEKDDFSNEIIILRQSTEKIKELLSNLVIQDDKKQELLNVLSGVNKNIDMIESIIKNPSYEEEFLLKDLLFFACVQILKRHPNTICGDIIGYKGEGIGERIKIHFQESISDKKIFCEGYEIQLLFFNLMSNAIDAILGEGNIYFNITYADDSLLIEFSDDGQLISDDNLKKIGYGEFFSTKGKLHGHGLQIIKDIVHKHNGKITIFNDDEKKRVVFKITLFFKAQEFNK